MSKYVNCLYEEYFEIIYMYTLPPSNLNFSVGILNMILKLSLISNKPFKIQFSILLLLLQLHYSCHSLSGLHKIGFYSISPFLFTRFIDVLVNTYPLSLNKLRFSIGTLNIEKCLFIEVDREVRQS